MTDGYIRVKGARVNNLKNCTTAYCASCGPTRLL